FSDETSFRELVVWLEDQKIRHYKIEDRKGLKNTSAQDWNNAFYAYLSNLNCPKCISFKDRAAVVDWLLGQAVSLEYSDNTDKYKLETAETVLSRKKNVPEVVNTNPLDTLDFRSSDFRDGVNQLAKMLKINPHSDHLVTLKAVSILIRTRLTQDALQNPGLVVHQGKPYPVFESDLGFETGDKELNSAGKALRLMYIHDLRDLQTKINECIVACQTITANPKTDTKLGKVGY
ncbi:UNVERIFIED_CONTAM: hypothetical protein GTU68_013652, partial [Idotea baltica]|nr:hypothetical protein [Idotea baltica]